MRFLLSLFITIPILISGCKEICGYESISECTKTLPKGEYCDAFFERWFYSKEKNSCSLIQYSGCNEYGFTTQSECEACLCYRGKLKQRIPEKSCINDKITHRQKQNNYT